MRRSLLPLLLVFFVLSCGNNSTTSSLVESARLYDGEEAKLEDPYRQYLWHIEYPSNAAFVSKYHIDTNASANIAKAWELTKGEGVLVAVIDNGFEATHEDLEDNIVLTYNVSEKNSDVSNEEQINHGSATTGIIVADSNDVGTIGVAPKAKVVLIKDAALSTDAQMVEAFEYAQKSGARVVNCSWGTYSVSDVVISKLQELYDNGIVVVFASGNDALSLDRYGINDESELPSVLGVGSSNELNIRSSYSSYGRSMDFLAPAGEYIGVLTTDSYGGNHLGDYRGLLDEGYSFFSGTSASAPVVSGIVALMLSVNPDLSPKEVRDILIATAQKIGGVTYDAVGWNPKYAYGKVDAYQAVLAAKNYQK